VVDWRQEQPSGARDVQAPLERTRRIHGPQGRREGRTRTRRHDHRSPEDRRTQDRTQGQEGTQDQRQEVREEEVQEGNRDRISEYARNKVSQGPLGPCFHLS